MSEKSKHVREHILYGQQSQTHSTQLEPLSPGFMEVLRLNRGQVSFSPTQQHTGEPIV